MLLISSMPIWSRLQITTGIATCWRVRLRNTWGGPSNIAKLAAQDHLVSAWSSTFLILLPRGINQEQENVFAAKALLHHQLQSTLSPLFRNDTRRSGQLNITTGVGTCWTHVAGILLAAYFLCYIMQHLCLFCFLIRNGEDRCTTNRFRMIQPHLITSELRPGKGLVVLLLPSPRSPRHVSGQSVWSPSPWLVPVQSSSTMFNSDHESNVFVDYSG